MNIFDTDISRSINTNTKVMNLAFFGIFMLLKISVSKILAHGRLRYFKTTNFFLEMTSNVIYVVALGVGFKCPHKIHLKTPCPGVIGLI